MNFAANCIPLSQLDVRELTRPSSALEGLARETTALPGSLLLAFDPTASGKRPAIVYCSHGVSEEHRKRQKGSGELDGSAHAVSPAHNCILR